MERGSARENWIMDDVCLYKHTSFRFIQYSTLSKLVGIGLFMKCKCLHSDLLYRQPTLKDDSRTL